MEQQVAEESKLIQDPKLIEAIKKLFENWAKHNEFILNWNEETLSYSDKHTQGAYMAFFVGFEWGLVS
ncbi:hypothetical protein UFOVP26_58 [uncultured Caudovirales phage]|uniref:Uncharacterized protein n=1 Tax=uncultured Caudovirales phage TaxID=2100421 RepID=A0A6J7WV09_9CAUD|nr:hypothetical protein UFOVP26_58 [uncultured Caudovirales phage]CAB4123709.1 hypothetical protein UFOVP44_39 [uncultured Caudovirales phage]CAB5219073.1 hypothetical protein UFOVP220_30 [uncultured Caudovirales phage]